jgi:hypothetical protein
VSLFEKSGDLLVGPVALVSLGVLLINDWFLKRMLHDPLTGKISDIAGLILVPIVLVSVVEIVVARRGRRWGLRAGTVNAVVGVVAVSFVAVKLWGPAERVFLAASSAVAWPAYEFRSLLHGGLMGLPAVHVVRDPTDLLVLPVLVVPWYLARSRHASVPNSKTTRVS